MAYVQISSTYNSTGSMTTTGTGDVKDSAAVAADLYTTNHWYKEGGRLCSHHGVRTDV